MLTSLAGRRTGLVEAVAVCGCRLPATAFSRNSSSSSHCFSATTTYVEIELFSCLEYLSLGFPVAITKAFIIEVGSVTRLSVKVYPLLVSHNKLGLTPRKLGAVSLDEQHQGGHGDINKITGCAVSVDIF